MVDREVLLARIRNRPNNVKPRELCTLVELYEFELRRTSGSHYIYRRGRHMITIPYHARSLSSLVVRNTLRTLDEVIEEQSPGDPDLGSRK
jgi:predicted RNA binding protein YcfA (HicA-like mRNA interferase family)